MKSIAPLDFSNVIAFLLPGFVAFYSLGYISPRVSQILEASLRGDAGAGVILILILFSLTAGIVVGAARSLVLDWLQFKTGVSKPALDYSKLAEENTLAAFNEAIANTYRFAQFHGNMFISMLMLAASKFWFRLNLAQWPLYVMLGTTLVILFFAHRRQLGQTYEKLGQLIPGEEHNGRKEERKEESKEET